MKKAVLHFILLLLFFTSSSTVYSQPSIGVHNINFYMFSREGQPFFPYAVNISGLMQPSVPEEQIHHLITQSASAGINTLRVVVDESHTPTAPLAAFEEPNGRLKPEVLRRLDLIFQEAKTNGLFVVLSLIDIQSIAMNWDRHPHNKKNGGLCPELLDIFTDNAVLARYTERVKQLVERYQKENVLAWEIARGPNVWDEVEGLRFRPANEYMKRVNFWIIRLANEIKRADTQKHLKALCYAPNTLPSGLMDNDLIDVNFLQIYSSKTPLFAVQSIPRLIQQSRLSRKPVFIAEANWGGASSLRDEYSQNLFWASLASCSGTFLHTHLDGENYYLSSFHQRLIQQAKIYLKNIDLAGGPRPVSPAPIEIKLPENYFLAESLVGNDWMFWILKNNPGSGPAQILFRTVEGTYEYYWQDLENNQERRKEFETRRKRVSLQSPDFEHDIIGRLRYLKPYAPNPVKTENPTDVTVPDGQ